jgi:DNA-directed RNA polymerase specialized sigma24 family protein
VEVTHALSNPPLSFEKLGRRLPPEGTEHEPSVRPIQRQTRLDETQRRELAQRHLAGERAFELASAFNVNRRTVAQILIDAGIRRPRSMTTDEVTNAIERYAQGESCADIGRALGRNHGTVWLALKAAGVELRDTHGRAP